VVVGALRGTMPTLAEEALGRIGFRAAARGNEVFASKACSGPIPLPLRSLPEEGPL
jgi:hypothetical protein